MPMIIASAVIRTGRKRVKPAASAAHAVRLLQPLLREGDHQDAVRGRDAHAHDGADQRGTLNVVREMKNNQYDAGQRRRQRCDNDEGSSHDWKFTTISR